MWLFLYFKYWFVHCIELVLKCHVFYSIKIKKLSKFFKSCQDVNYAYLFLDSKYY